MPNLNAYHAAPTAIRNKPIPAELEALVAYLFVFEPRIAARTSIQPPESTIIMGIINVQSIKSPIKRTMATTTIIRNTPRERSAFLLSAINALFLSDFGAAFRTELRTCSNRFATVGAIHHSSGCRRKLRSALGAEFRCRRDP